MVVMANGDGDNLYELLPLKSEVRKGRWVGTAPVCRSQVQSEGAQILSLWVYNPGEGRAQSSTDSETSPP